MPSARTPTHVTGSIAGCSEKRVASATFPEGRVIRKSHVLFTIAAFAMSSALPAGVAAQTKPLCIGDSVVWENSRSKIYHAEGDPYFGKTAHGQYACKAAAEKDGYRLSRSTGGSSGGAKSKTSAASKSAPSKPAASSKPAFSLFGPRATAMPASRSAAPVPASPGLGTAAPAPTATRKPRRSRKNSTSASATPAPTATKKPRRSRKKKASPSPNAT